MSEPAASDVDEGSQIFEFEGFRLDLTKRQLYGPNGAPMRLSSRVFDTLAFFVTHRGELLDKRVLMDEVWGGMAVEENNLNQAVSALRRALGEKPGEHRFVITVPGRGYQFVPEVRIATTSTEKTVETDHDAPSPAPGSQKSVAPSTPSPTITASIGEPAPSTSGFLDIVRDSIPSRIPTPAAVIAIALAVIVALGLWNRQPIDPATANLRAPGERPSIAVLPFVDLSPGGGQAYLSEGIADELLSELTRLEGLTVAGRVSSFFYRDGNANPREVGEALGVDVILEGSVVKADARLRVRARLVSAADGFQLWAQTYDRELTDVIAIQEDIAHSVVDALSVELGVGETSLGDVGTTNIAAYEAYLEGKALMEIGDVIYNTQAITPLERAVELDPEFAPAWASLSRAYAFGDTASISRSKEAATRAVTLAPELGRAHEALGTVLALGERDYVNAENAYRRALTLSRDPVTSHRLGSLLLLLGQARASLNYSRQATFDDPLAVNPIAWLAFTYAVLGDQERALQQFERTRTLPTRWNTTETYWLLTVMGERDITLARAQVEQFLEFAEPERAFYDQLLPVIENRDAALRVAHQFRHDPGAGFHAAMWAAFYDDPALALDAYTQWQRARFRPLIGGRQWAPLFSDMRQQPEFIEFLSEIGVTEYWRAKSSAGDFCLLTEDDRAVCQ